jgi:hypothetical protein
VTVVSVIKTFEPTLLLLLLTLFTQQQQLPCQVRPLPIRKHCCATAQQACSTAAQHAAKLLQHCTAQLQPALLLLLLLQQLLQRRLQPLVVPEARHRPALSIPQASELRLQLLSLDAVPLRKDGQCR